MVFAAYALILAQHFHGQLRCHLNLGDKDKLFWSEQFIDILLMKVSEFFAIYFLSDRSIAIFAVLGARLNHPLRLGQPWRISLRQCLGVFCGLWCKYIYRRHLRHIFIRSQGENSKVLYSLLLIWYMYCTLQPKEKRIGKPDFTCNKLICTNTVQNIIIFMVKS